MSARRPATAAPGRVALAVAHLTHLDPASGLNALGLSSPDRTMAALRHRRLPLAWSRDGTRMRPLPRFRGYLRKRADAMGENARRELRRRHATLLEASGRHEEAVTELLMAGEAAAARRAAEQVLAGVLDRLDLATAESWLDRMRPTPGPPAPELVSAALRVAFGREQCWRGLRLADEHGPFWWGALPGQPGGSEDLALLLWCFWHAGRTDEARQMLRVMPPAATATSPRPSCPWRTAPPSHRFRTYGPTPRARSRSC